MGARFNVSGYVYDVELASSISAPTIKASVILLPEGMGGACPLAEYDPATGSPLAVTGGGGHPQHRCHRWLRHRPLRHAARVHS